MKADDHTQASEPISASPAGAPPLPAGTKVPQGVAEQPPAKPMPPSAQRSDALDDVQTHMRSQADIDRQERIEYMRRVAGPRKPKKAWWKWLLVGLAVALVAAAATYLLFLKPKDKDKQASQSTKSSQSTPPAQQQSAAITTKHHQSANFSLEFDYPENWTVTDDGSGKLTVKSPTMPLKSASGKAVSGQVTVTIQGKQAELKEFKGGNGLAVRESDKLTYTKPTSSQRAQTYLSFVGYAGSAQTGIDGMYITGDIGYQKDQAVPMVDVVRGDPLVTVSFSGSGGTLSISSDSWNDSNQLTKSLKTIITSLSIQ
jgi:hypothetical protein